MIYGFTGTRNGLTHSQKEKLFNILNNDKNNIEEVHHGDCIGADKYFHNLCNSLSSSIKIIIHPSKRNIFRAFCNSENILQPKDYLSINKDIVYSCDILIACPESYIEVLRSGTWSTIRYARKIGKKVMII